LRERNFTKEVHMWNCTCGRKNEEDANFCSECGQKRPQLTPEEQLAQLTKRVDSLQKEVEDLREELRQKNQQESWLKKAWKWFKSH
jgi:TolA-binding protein